MQEGRRKARKKERKEKGRQERKHKRRKAKKKEKRKVRKKKTRGREKLHNEYHSMKKKTETNEGLALTCDTSLNI